MALAQDNALPARDAMDRIYGWQKNIYDITRKPYLLGRDLIISELDPQAGDCVMEIGCGTARNLVKAARAWPQASFYGMDVSTEMLSIAQRSLMRANMAQRIKLALADATQFDPQKTFGVAGFERIMFSYTLSMIPQWETVLENALNHLKPGGQILIADFGDQNELPGAFKTVLHRWLALFHVTPRQDMQEKVEAIAQRHGAQLHFRRIFRGYAFIAVIKKPAL